LWWNKDLKFDKTDKIDKISEIIIDSDKDSTFNMITFYNSKHIKKLDIKVINLVMIYQLIKYIKYDIKINIFMEFILQRDVKNIL
jgi:hypothetical protein